MEAFKKNDKMYEFWEASLKEFVGHTPLQVAAIAALEGDQQSVRDISEQYKRRRDVLVKGLNQAG